MPLARLALILVVVIAAAGATIWLATTLLAASVAPGWALAALIPAGLLAYVLVRLLAEREAAPQDTRYDRIER